MRLGEFHRFASGGAEFLYLVPSAAIFALDEVSGAVVDSLAAGDLEFDELAARLSGRFRASEVHDAVFELRGVHAVDGGERVTARQMPPAKFPLSTVVLNLTNQCNLACTYCYEYGEDKIADTQFGSQPKFMDAATARDTVEFLLNESGRRAHLTFFGGETLLNFPVLRETIEYARRRAAEVGKEIDFSLTTNATLLREVIIEFLAENHVGVTVSIDGPREMQDQLRVFHNGRGSYDVVAPKVKELLRRHRSRPIGARVTLTSQTLDVQRVFRHLREEIGFWEVGFAPVTTSPQRAYAIEERGFDDMLAQFRELAGEFLEYTVANRHHGFSNVRDTVEELHQGMSKSHPCGAGLGLLGVSTSGDVALCHRFAGSETHKMGTVRGGIDRLVQIEFLTRHHVDDKTDCRQCWARPLCAGGCYHEAHTRYGDTRRPNLHYCEWIRGWTDTCLQIYGELAVRNPDYLRRLDREERHEASQVSQ